MSIMRQIKRNNVARICLIAENLFLSGLSMKWNHSWGCSVHLREVKLQILIRDSFSYPWKDLHSWGNEESLYCVEILGQQNFLPTFFLIPSREVSSFLFLDFVNFTVFAFVLLF